VDGVCQIAGLPPKTAFYAVPIGLLTFAIFGTSRQLVVAISAIIATMSFATVSLIAAPNTPEFILLTAALAIIFGCALIANHSIPGMSLAYIWVCAIPGVVGGTFLIVRAFQVRMA
jgi:SulP family sulfate permease